MKISIFLIIGFTHFVFCCDLNVTDDLYAQCPVKFFRRKRAAEYTRWRANIEPTPEFIVKVLDEDISSQKAKKIVAVNIQPVTKGVEKIIIGGAMVTVPTTKPTSAVATAETVKDYTRFVPPTTVATRIEGDFYVAPPHPVKRTDNFQPIGPKVRNPQRDESPPARPQFLPRSQLGAVRQYAPIAPVAFGQHSQIPPLTPPLNAVSESYMIRKAIADMIRSTPSDDIIVPTRTKSDMEEFGHLHAFEEDSDQSYVTRTTYESQNEPDRTVNEFHDTTSTETEFKPTTEKTDDYAEKKNEDKESDSEDGIFYNYVDEVPKNIGKSSTDSYDDKFQNEQNQSYVPDAKDDVPRVGFVLKAREDAASEDIPDIYRDIPEKSVTYKMSNTIESSTSTTTPSTTRKVHIALKNVKETLRDKRRQICSMVKLRELNFNMPRTLPEIEAKLKQWAEESPVAKWVDITDGNLTAMERPIYMMIVDDPSSGQVISAKRTVAIVAGIQGRDQHAVTAAMYVLFQLIERTDQHTDLLSKFRFWVIPVLNPDGYDYAMTFPQRREWTKNLRQNWDVCKGRGACYSCESFGLRCTIQPCYGVNLDRNFEYQWIPAEELRMEHPCGALYAGKRQLSEVETAAFVKYVHTQHRPIYLFIAFKEGEVLGVMYPYSHTRKKRAFEHIFKQRASRAAAAAYSISGRPYLAGQTSQFLPLYAGGIEDWVDGHLGVDNTFTIMMFRPTDSLSSKILTERVVHEAYAAMDTLVLQSIEEPAEQLPQVVMVHAKASATTSAHICTALLLVATALPMRPT